MKLDIKSYPLEELKQLFMDITLPQYRATQLFYWLHKKGVESFDEMTNLPLPLRQKLEEKYNISHCTVEQKLVSAIDGTVKYLFCLPDGALVESVVMQYKYGYSMCVSSQVGCKMGCSFCASGLDGFQRNLTAGEIISQIQRAQVDLDVRISHVVLMGMGEPLDNFDHVINFLKIVNHNEGLNISMRNISLSTCGIVPRIYDLIEQDLPITLSISLHAPNDRIRSVLMPVNDKWGVAELIKACKDYAKSGNRRISFEYTLIEGVNDSQACAQELADLLQGMLCHVNLIPVNPVDEHSFGKSSNKRITNFTYVLKRRGINATIRRTLGADINASCGQLRRQEAQTR